LCGGKNPGNQTTMSHFPLAIAARATPRCPEWGGSKLPPKKTFLVIKSLSNKCFKHKVMFFF
jgi:hypothetical protein